MTNIENKTLELKIGNYEIHAIPTGFFGLDGGAMFGTVPKVLWEKSNPADEKNRILMEARALLLKSDGMNILIDSGNGEHFIEKYGEKLGSKFQEMFNIKSDGHSLIKSLKKYNLTPEDIHHVIYTHLHFDHCGGGVKAENGKLIPAFPNATYHIQKKNLEIAQNPNLRERSSYYSANFQPLIECNQLQIHDGAQINFLPLISSILSHGHTEGQQSIKISDGKQTLLYCGDMIPTSSHIRLAWLMGYDLNPLLLMEEKQKILEIATHEEWYLFFEHDPYSDVATVIKNGNDFAAKERFQLN